MRARPGQRLPLVPLLRAYTGAGVLRLEELTRLPGLGPRFQAVLEARTHLLSEAFLDQATEADFQGALVRFYEACVRPALHTDTLRRRTGIVRHALGHLLRCRDPLPQKADRCLAVDAPYHVAGLGPVFWSALFQGLAPMSFPAWTPAIEAGLRRLGLASWQQATRPGEVYGAMVRVYAHLRALEPALIPFHLDHFLTLTAAMKGRNIWSGADHL
ncbi:MAG: hypothetical protein JO112_21320, partial [Planctomycetes bacterium]|nr:hypothetical protein [Planctomycetota bacterium]